ncbi:ABC transporter substrate-binding protein [Rhizobium leguminosarum bv. viciae]|nr:ABC transporter substrate-binding protein [Rhizobium leguminosarum bv. viciae]
MINVEVMSTLAVEKALNTWLLPQWQNSDAQIQFDWRPTSQLMDSVKAGHRADVAILIDGAMAYLASSGVILPDSVTPVATAGFGLGARTGATLPDISTTAKFRSALLAAESIAFSKTGASGIYFSELVHKLGVADEVNAKSVIIESGFTGELVVSGQAQYAVQQISELMSVNGVSVVGPFPAELQVATDFSAGIFSDARQPALARTFLEYLTSPIAYEAYSSGGLVPRFEASMNHEDR